MVSCGGKSIGAGLRGGGCCNKREDDDTLLSALNVLTCGQCSVGSNNSTRSTASGSGLADNITRAASTYLITAS